MKRLLVALVILLIATPVFAMNIDSSMWNKLTDSQKAQIIQQIADQADRAKPNLVSTVTDPDKVGKWVGIGEQIGKMIGGAAKEVNVAVNEFVKSPVGMATMGLIVWHYMGGAIVHILGGLFLFLTGIWFLLFLMRKSTPTNYVYDSEKTDVFGRSRLKSINRASLKDSDQGAYLACFAVLTVISLFTVFTF